MLGAVKSVDISSDVPATKSDLFPIAQLYATNRTNILLSLTLPPQSPRLNSTPEVSAPPPSGQGVGARGCLFAFSAGEAGWRSRGDDSAAPESDLQGSCSLQKFSIPERGMDSRCRD